MHSSYSAASAGKQRQVPFGASPAASAECSSSQYVEDDNDDSDSESSCVADTERCLRDSIISGGGTAPLDHLDGEADDDDEDEEGNEEEDGAGNVSKDHKAGACSRLEPQECPTATLGLVDSTGPQSQVREDADSHQRQQLQQQLEKQRQQHEQLSSGVHRSASAWHETLGGSSQSRSHESFTKDEERSHFPVVNDDDKSESASMLDDSSSSTRDCGATSEEHEASAVGGAMEELADKLAYLPDDCLSVILRKLEGAASMQSSLVCRRWLEVDSASRPVLALRAPQGLEPSLPRLLNRFSGLQKLVLKADRGTPSISDAGLSAVAAGCPTLRKLKLKNCKQLTDAGIEAFARASPDLRKFSFGGCGFGVAGLSALLRLCAQLEDLTVKRSFKCGAIEAAAAADAAAIAAGAAVPEGGSHAAAATAAIAAAAAAPPAPQPTLSLPEALRLVRLCLKDQSMSTMWEPLLCACPKLETLILARNAGAWDDVLQASLGQGKTPKLSQLYLERLRLSDRALTAVAKCPQLEALVVVRTPECTDAGMSAVARGCSGLRRLHIEGWAARHIGDEGLIALARGCKQMQELVLVGHSCTVTSMRTLASNCPNLERLTLCSSPTTGDAEVMVVAQSCPSLRRLCVKGCSRVSDRAIIALASGCPSLQRFKIRRCSGVSHAAVAFLQARRPTLSITTQQEPSSNSHAAAAAAAVGHGGPAAAAAAALGLRGHGDNRPHLHRHHHHHQHHHAARAMARGMVAGAGAAPGGLAGGRAGDVVAGNHDPHHHQHHHHLHQQAAGGARGGRVISPDRLTGLEGQRTAEALERARGVAGSRLALAASSLFSATLRRWIGGHGGAAAPAEEDVPWLGARSYPGPPDQDRRNLGHGH